MSPSAYPPDMVELSLATWTASSRRPAEVCSAADFVSHPVARQLFDKPSPEFASLSHRQSGTIIIGMPGDVLGAPLAKTFHCHSQGKRHTYALVNGSDSDNNWRGSLTQIALHSILSRPSPQCRFSKDYITTYSEISTLISVTPRQKIYIDSTEREEHRCLP
jgi:hypothetical protein